MHVSVLLNEVIEYLNLASGKNFLDATLDGGGHSREILKRYPDVKVLGIEFDPVLIQDFRRDNQDILGKMIVVNDSYVNMREVCREHGFEPDGVLFDLGLSSWHYEQSGRGFSFNKDEPLDMRFNPERESRTAANIINEESKSEIADILEKYGEEKFAAEIAENIIKERAKEPITTVFKLVQIIESCVPGWYRHQKIHCATKTFQALRVYINKELENVRNGLEAAIEVLRPGGRLVVISFQGHEDKLVREIFKEKAKEGKIKWVTKTTIRPKWAEIKKNPRSRSAKMKIAEKI
jgi:16S rRNA (cytosine1402-N4)-methyltransferase